MQKWYRLKQYEGINCSLFAISPLDTIVQKSSYTVSSKYDCT